MNRFIKSILSFSVFSLSWYVLCIIGWGEYAPDLFKKNLNYPIGSYGHMYSRLQEIKDVRDVDILILGSSHAYRGFDPRIFKEYGLNTFNLGSSGQSHLQTTLLLRRYLDKIQPRLIIYEVYPQVFSLDGVESALDISATDQNDLESIKMALSQNHVKVYNALIYGFYRDIFRKDSHFKEDRIKGEDIYIEGGFVEKKPQALGPIEFVSGSWKLSGKQFGFFENALLLIQERNIPVILVQAPITHSMYGSFANNHEFDDKMREYGTYYNFNELMKLNDQLHFYNADHLNQTGVELFNRKLIEVLLETGAVKSHK
jgi:hypothetical protein